MISFLTEIPIYEKRVRYNVCPEWNVLSNALSRGAQIPVTDFYSGT